MEEEKGGWRILFDFSFKKFIMLDLVRILYILAVIFTAVICLFIVVGAIGIFAAHPGFAEALYALAMLILAPVVFFLNLCATRVYLEALIILYRIREDIVDIREKKGGETS
jgi:hypothetical protein